MLKLAKCIAPPLCNWALQITSALCIISTENAHTVSELLPPPVVEGEVHKRPPVGIFEQIVTGLSVSCKAFPLPADSFTFIFPVFSLLSDIPSVLVCQCTYCFPEFILILLLSDYGADSAFFKEDSSS